jgi:hypothetical protein
LSSIVPDLVGHEPRSHLSIAEGFARPDPDEWTRDRGA